MNLVKLAAVLAGAATLAGCLPLAQSPMSGSAGPGMTAGSTGPATASLVPARTPGALLYGSAEPVHVPRTAASARAPIMDAAPAATPTVHSAQLGRTATPRATDVPAQAANESSDVIYSEQWYQREKEAQTRLNASTQICRGC